MHQHFNAEAPHSNSAAQLAQRVSSGRERGARGEALRRERTSREMTKLEWRAYSYGPAFCSGE